MEAEKKRKHARVRTASPQRRYIKAERTFWHFVSELLPRSRLKAAGSEWKERKGEAKWRKRAAVESGRAVVEQHAGVPAGRQECLAAPSEGALWGGLGVGAAAGAGAGFDEAVDGAGEGGDRSCAGG
jgi:hypothetical protein